MADEKKTVDVPNAVPVEAGEPVPADAVTQQGSTFAKRAAARQKQLDAATAENKSVSSESASRKKKS